MLFNRNKSFIKLEKLNNGEAKIEVRNIPLSIAADMLACALTNLLKNNLELPVETAIELTTAHIKKRYEVGGDVDA